MALVTACVLAGCVSTQTKNARTVLVNERTLDSERTVRVVTPNPHVTVSGIQLIHAGRGLAVVVSLHNDDAHPVSDLPISIGYRTAGGHAVYLNGRANQPYFSTHIAAMSAGASAQWVLTLRHAPALRGRVFATVGIASTPAGTHSATLPRLTLATSATTADGRQLRIWISNQSAVPQYGLPVYAVAARDGRDVAAARGSIGELDGGSRTTLTLNVVGTTTGATLRLFAAPTIFN